MLRQIKFLSDIKYHANYVYKIAMEDWCVSYPIYTDGIKTKEDFIAAAEKAFAGENSEIFEYYFEGPSFPCEELGIFGGQERFVSWESFEGWIHYFWIPEEKYLQLTGFYINKGGLFAMMELLEMLEERFAGYTLYFGFPEKNDEAITVLKSSGFECIEDDWNYSFFFDKYELQPETEAIKRITRENYEDFRAVYRPDENTYWNCDRILECLDEWFIYCHYEKEVPTEAVFLRGEDGYYEIFGMEFADGEFLEDVARALLVSALNQCKRMEAKYMTYFCEEKMRKTVEELGFQGVGEYLCYQKRI